MYGYERIHAAFYDITSEGLEGDVQFYLEEARAAGSPVLELGAGTGRTLIPIAEAGIDVVGLDLSPAMLQVAREKVDRLPSEVQAHIELVEGDMRDFSLGRKFALVTIPYRAFLHLMTVQDQRAALARIREHMRDDGKLMLNIFDPKLEIIAAHSGPMGAAFKKLGQFTHPDTGRTIMVLDSRHYDSERQVVTEDRVFEELGEEGQVLSRTYSPLTLRWVYRYEMEHLFELC